jgi:pimeloyl-ACP methyl ester carboxylesterase
MHARAAVRGPERAHGTDEADRTDETDGTDGTDERAGTDRAERARGDAGGPRSVAVDGGRVSYAEYGDPAGAPVLLLHGTPGSRLLGALFHAPARDRGVRLLAPDRPGYGRSSPREGATPADADALLTPVLDDAGVERAGVAAFSGGAPYALALAASRPDRVAAVEVVSGAAPPALVDDPPGATRALSTLGTRAPRLLGGLFRVLAGVARVSPRVVVAQYTTGAASVPDGDARLVRDEFVEAVARTRAGVVRESRLLDRAWDVDLDAVERPVRLRHGARDANVPVAAARRLADRLGARATVLDDADHLGTLLRTREPVLDRLAAAASPAAADDGPDPGAGPGSGG